MYQPRHLENRIKKNVYCISKEKNYYTVYQKEIYTILDVKRRNILFCILKRRNILYCILKGETYYTAYQKEKSIIPYIKRRNMLHCKSNGEKYITVYQKKKHTLLYILKGETYT